MCKTVGGTEIPSGIKSHCHVYVQYDDYPKKSLRFALSVVIRPTYPWIKYICTVSVIHKLVILVPKAVNRASLHAMLKLTALDHNCGSYRFFMFVPAHLICTQLHIVTPDLC